MTARLRIDRTRCAGHGICVLFAPGLLDLDAWGFPELEVETVEPRELSRATRAVTACPRQALSIEQVPPPLRPLRAPSTREATWWTSTPATGDGGPTEPA